MNRLILGLAVLFGALVATVPARADDNATSFKRGKGYIRVPGAGDVFAVTSNVLFLNKCVGGCDITYGYDNSSQDRSQIAEGHLAEFRYSAAKWDEVVACVQDVFSPFDVVITDVDPGAAEHMEAIVAGLACDVSNDPDCPYILGFAPFDCSYIPRSMSFTFANANYYAPGGGDVDELCATIAQEVAHTWGLDHEILASDPMTYQPYNGRRQFQDELVQCGEYPGPNPPAQIHSCGCGGQQQNSVAEITALFGAGTPTPPHMTITDPEDGAQVEAGFQVVAEGDEALQKVELRIDGGLIDTINNPPYAFNAPDDLGEGTHTVQVTGYDTQGEPGRKTISVIIGEPCGDDSDCEAQGEGLVCVGGRCVLGDGYEGGLGTPCTGDVDCSSGLCLAQGDEMRCVETCNPGSDDCPGSYDCLSFEDGGVCWPGDGGGGGGCASTEDSGGAAALPIGFGLAFAGLMFRRRRRTSPR